MVQSNDSFDILCADLTAQKLDSTKRADLLVFSVKKTTPAFTDVKVVEISQQQSAFFQTSRTLTMSYGHHTVNGGGKLDILVIY